MMKQRTIMDMLLKRYDERVALLEADAAITFSDAACVTDRKKYLKEIMTAIDANQIVIAFQPVIFATNRSRTLVTEYKADRRGSNLSAADVFGIVSSPDVFVWLPDKKTLFPGDNFYRTFPNLYTIRGTPYRDLAGWVNSLDMMRYLEPEYLVPNIQVLNISSYLGY